jgi:hypothetical protein
MLVTAELADPTVDGGPMRVVSLAPESELLLVTYLAVVC